MLPEEAQSHAVLQYIILKVPSELKLPNALLPFTSCWGHQGPTRVLLNSSITRVKDHEVHITAKRLERFLHGFVKVFVFDTQECPQILQASFNWSCVVSNQL